jgi:hypothetical protein
MSDEGNSLKTSLPHIKWGVLAILLALGTGGAIVMVTRAYLSHELRFKNMASSRLATARNNLKAAQEDRQNMSTYTQEYAALLQRNIIGKERRLDWIDGLDALRKRNIVLKFNYTISPQKPFTPPVPVKNGNFILNQSSMTIRFQLLHEGQLVNFFQALNNTIDGLFLLQGCDITRATGANTDNVTALAPQLTALCKGMWLTLKNRNTP